MVVVGTVVAEPMLLDGAALAAADPRPWRPWRLRLLKSTMLNLSNVVVVGTDVVVIGENISHRKYERDLSNI